MRANFPLLQRMWHKCTIQSCACRGVPCRRLTGGHIWASSSDRKWENWMGSGWCQCLCHTWEKGGEAICSDVPHGDQSKKKKKKLPFNHYIQVLLPLEGIILSELQKGDDDDVYLEENGLLVLYSWSWGSDGPLRLLHWSAMKISSFYQNCSLGTLSDDTRQSRAVI